jgi:two-component sensor histidine kinase
MATDAADTQGVEHLFSTPALADAIGTDRFKQFLDLVPVAIAVSETAPAERIIYANIAFEQLTGQDRETIVGQTWQSLPSIAGAASEDLPLAQAIMEGHDHIGAYHIKSNDVVAAVDAWANLIEEDDGVPAFRLVALVEPVSQTHADRAELAYQIQEKDTLLLELQHRVKNNLQMITALIRVEARNLPDHAVGASFDRLAGRVQALGLLYASLSTGGPDATVDLGVYLGQIATAVMRAHAVEGIHLDLQVDTWPVSINLAMPAGLVVNEVLTNALKHAFTGRQGGTITLHSLVDPTGCHVNIGDDGVGLPPGAQWPAQGKLSALIVRSLEQNAKARVDIQSAPGQGMQVAIFFACADAAPDD